MLDQIYTMNQKLESAITFCRSNHNGNYLARKNYLATQISVIFPEEKLIQQKNCDCNKLNLSRFNKDKFSKTKLSTGADIYDKTGLFSTEEWSKIRNNPGVIKMIY